MAALLFGASTPAASVLARDLSPLALAGLLYLGAALAVAPWSVVDRPDASALRRNWRLVAVAIVAGGAIGPALLTAGLVDTPAATASLLLNLELVATVVLAATWGHHVDLDFHFLAPTDVSAGLGTAGFAVTATIEREPWPSVEAPTRRCSILAHRSVG